MAIEETIVFKADGAEQIAASIAALDKQTANLTATAGGLQEKLTAIKNAMGNAKTEGEFLKQAEAARTLEATLNKVNSAIAARKQERADIDGTTAALQKQVAAEKAKAEATKAAKAAAADAAKAEKSAAEEAAKAVEKLAKDEKEAAKNANELHDRGGAMAIALGTLLADAAKEAAKLAIELGKSLVSSIYDINKAQGNTQSMVKLIAGSDSTSGGVAAVTKDLEDLAKKTGKSTGEVAAQFRKLQHDTGGFYKDVKALLPVLSDIEKVSPDEAANAMSDYQKAVENATARGKSDAAAQAEALEVIKDKYGALIPASDGFASAVDKLKTKGLEAMAKIAEKLGPKLEDLVNRFMAFADSADGQKMLSDAMTALSVTIDVVAKAAVILKDIWLTLTDGENTAADAGRALSVVLGPLSTIVGNVVQAATDLVTWMGQVGSKLSGVADTVGGAVTGAWEAISNQVSEWTTLGSDMIQGFIDGIEAKVGEVIAKVKGMADSAKATLTDALKIGSPSKVFEDYGGWTSEGFAQGIEPVDVADKMLGDMPTANDARQAGAAAAPSGMGGGGAMVINITVNGGGNAQEIANAVRDELTRTLSGLATSGGAAA